MSPRRPPARSPRRTALLAPSLVAALIAPGAATAQATRDVPPTAVRPALAFPEAGLDDSAAYAGYRTRLFRDAAGNTLQLYVEGRTGRVVHLLADAENASVGFTAHTAGAAARPAGLAWRGEGARVARTGRTRSVTHELVADVPALRVGGFLLGSMRVERDYQHLRLPERPLGATAYAVPEFARLAATLATLPAAERRRHLAALDAADLATLERRLRPTVAVDAGGVRVVQPSLDGRDTLTLALRVDPARVAVTRTGDGATLRARDGATSVPLAVTVTTTGATLTPLARAEIFRPEFLAFLAAERAAAEAPGADTARRAAARRLERQAVGVELLVSREKLMAGLPTYATYFGRDMLVTALMMRPVWRPAMLEFALGAALRKLDPATGGVSHEEALGGQASREAAAEWVGLVEAARRARADSLLAHARGVLAAHRRTRENHHMVDDEFQLPVVAARWLADSTVDAARKRAFLAARVDSAGPDTHLDRLLAELAYVARLTAPYAARPVVANLVAFPAREDGVRVAGAPWAARSWRDSGAGYAGGRYAMDVNAVWVPHALAAVRDVLAALRALDVDAAAAVRARPALAPLAAWVDGPAALDGALATWRGAARHFVVRLAPEAVRARVEARLAAMPAAERAAWAPRARAALAASAGDTLAFLDVALDGDGRPVGVANSDVATRLFLDATAPDALPADAAAQAARDAALFARAYPVGLLVPEAGPVVANDAYARPAVWAAFAADPYHGPRVVWGREVNLFLLGAAAHRARGDAPGLAAAMSAVRAAVDASGFHSELWRHAVRAGRIVPERYGTGADVQLWSTTDLAVRFVLDGAERAVTAP